ncbi:hypothetical protein K469DRAFT_728734 [Zopfia rhizophila CBS 207.26]|uniref:Uncharacterized protein n=1 Tax=Zopfia rhizophila CBS 207.26 TaxID=1314779 RepID=A0A6A6EUG8_9PEZI|nr:hypothetical protein K469DRAFT_728734 [Zopfia rhizophila CBS 207.26]
MTKIKCLCCTLSQICPVCLGLLDEDEYRFIVYPGAQTVLILCDIHGLLTRCKRYWLALTLMSSYLQLGSTPWLNTPLRKDSVLFFRDPSNTDALLLDSPYICGDMPKEAAININDTISTLGIRLLELCFGTPLESSRIVSEQAGPGFAEAVDWCLHAEELSNGSWRKEICTRVIVPLDYCHKQISKQLVTH